MKTWIGYGSEHSMNLVMIGNFKTVDGAKKVNDVIDQISAQVIKEDALPRSDMPETECRYSDTMTQLLSTIGIHSIGPTELEQFLFDVQVTLNGTNVEIRTDESEISAYLKLLLNWGAKVELYSAHDYSPGSDDNNI